MPVLRAGVIPPEFAHGFTTRDVDPDALFAPAHRPPALPRPPGAPRRRDRGAGGRGPLRRRGPRPPTSVRGPPAPGGGRGHRRLRAHPAVRPGRRRVRRGARRLARHGARVVAGRRSRRWSSASAPRPPTSAPPSAPPSAAPATRWATTSRAEVAALDPGAVTRDAAGRAHADLRRCNRTLLLAAGVPRRPHRGLGRLHPVRPGRALPLLPPRRRNPGEQLAFIGRPG